MMAAANGSLHGRDRHTTGDEVSSPQHRTGRSWDPGPNRPCVATVLSGIECDPERIDLMRSRCLRVNGLDPRTDRQSLIQHFQKVTMDGTGEVESAEIDNNTNSAIITFRSTEVARQMASLEHKLGDQILQVSLMDKPTDPPAISPSGCVRVRHVPDGVAFETLHGYFQEDQLSGGGAVKKVKWDGDGKSAMIEFKDPAIAQRVAQREHLFDGNPFQVELVDESKVPMRKSSSDHTDTTWVLITGLPIGFDTELLELMLESPRYSGGTLNELTPLSDGTSALVHFTDSKVAEEFSQKEHHLFDSPVHVELVASSQASEMSKTIPTITSNGNHVKTIEVSGYPSNITTEQLQEYFEDPVRSGGGHVKEMRKSGRMSFFTFANQAVVDSVCSRNHQIEGCSLLVIKAHTDHHDVLQDDNSSPVTSQQPVSSDSVVEECIACPRDANESGNKDSETDDRATQQDNERQHFPETNDDTDELGVNEQATDVSEEPVDVSEQPTDVSEQPVDVSKQPTDVSEQPVDVSEQPDDTDVNIDIKISDSEENKSDEIETLSDGEHPLAQNSPRSNDEDGRENSVDGMSDTAAAAIDPSIKDEDADDDYPGDDGHLTCVDDGAGSDNHGHFEHTTSQEEDDDFEKETSQDCYGEYRDQGDESGTDTLVDDLEPLRAAASCSDEPVNLTLEVQNIPSKWLVDEDMIKMVFEREKIGGGQVQTVIIFPNDREAHVTFCEAHVPKRLAIQGTIVHGREQLHVRFLPQTTKRELQEPDPTEGTIEVSNVPERFMDKDMLSTYFESPRKGGGEVKDVEIVQGESRAYVTFRDPSISTRLAEGGSFTLGKESVLVSLKTDKADEDRTEYTTTPTSSTLEVASIPDTFMNEEMLRLYFENPNKGGGEISDVVLVQHQAKALLTFLDHEVCHLLAQKGDLRLGNHQVTVQLFVEEDTEKNNENAMLPFIELHGIPEHLQNEDILKLYLENPLTGGGKIASVVLIPEESKANITFCDPNVSLCLAEKGKVSIGKREVTINLPACEPQEEHLDTIEVSCLPDSWANEEMLRLYFENPIKGGGPICDITIAASEKKALVKFEDPQVASDFTAKGEIILGKSPVPIALFKPPPPVNPCTIELYDLDPSTLNEDVLRLYFENAKYNGGPITSVEIYPGVSRALITFTEQEVAQSFLDNGMLQVGKRTFKIRAPSPKETTKAPISNTIAVTGIPPRMSEDFLEALFSNPLKTGGGPIEKIEVDGKQGSAIIRYHEAEVAERVVQKGHVSYKDDKLLISLVNPGEKETTIDQKTVHVSPLPDKCSRDILELFIETALDVSDVIEDVVLENDSAQITLIDSEMADKLVSLGRIKLPRGVMAAVEWMTTHPRHQSSCKQDSTCPTSSEDDEDDIGEFDTGPDEIIPSSSHTVLVWGVEEDDEDCLKDLFAGICSNDNFSMQLLCNDNAIEVLLYFQDIENALQVHNAVLEWNNDLEDIIMQGASFLYDPLVNKTLAIQIEGLMPGADLNKVVMRIEDDCPDVNIEEQWSDTQGGEAVLTLDSIASVDDVIETMGSSISYPEGRDGHLYIQALPLPIQPKLPNGPVERNKLFVRYVPSEALDDDLNKFIEKGTRCEIQEVHYSPTKPGSVMLILSSKPDYASMRILASSRPLCGIFLCVEQVEMSNWVQIFPVEEGDFEFLEYAVESDEWGGGSTVSDPIYNEEWKTALVQYTTHEGAINTCKEKKKFRKKEVDVREYFPDLGILPEDADYTSPDVWVPQPVEVDLTEKSRNFMKFKSANNIFSLPQSNLDIKFKDGRATMKCTLQPQQKLFYSLCQTWKDSGEAALVEFDGTITHQVLTVKYKEVWDQFVRDCTTQLQLLKDLSHVEVDASQLRVTVCGITNEVYDAIQMVLDVKKKLEEEHRHKLDTKEEILDLPEITVKLLEKASHIEELKQKYPDLNLSINEDQVVLYGHKKTLAAAKNDIMEITVSVCTEVISEESAKLKLMKLEKVREYIDHKSESYPFLYELDEANSNVKLHFLEEEHKQPVLDVLNNLWSERIELDRSGQRAVKHGQKWVATHRDLMEEYGEQLVIDISEDFIDVAGVGDETRKAYDTICDFMEKYITVSEYMDLKFAIVRYLKQFHKRNINEMHDRYQDSNVKVQTLLIPGKSAVIVDGMKDGVKDCMTDLHHLINGISDKQLKIDKPGPSKYFCTDEGVADLKSIEDKSRVVIHIPGVTDETLAEVESAEQRRARAMHTPILAGEVETLKGKLTVYFGDVCAFSHVDAVVCGGTNGNLSYHQGLGKALTDKAGIDVKRELRQHTSTCGTLPSGEVFMTSAGSLPFQHILHTIIPVYSQNRSGVEEAVDGVMKKLLSENIKSVAIPAMGVSKAGYSIEDSTSQIVEAVVESLKKQGNFKEVCFVGYSQDHVRAFKSAMIAKFKNNFTDHDQASKDETVSASQTYSDVAPVKELVSYHTNEGIHFSVINGDITEQKFDAVMNTTNQHVDLSKGYVSNLLLEKAGPQLQKEVKQQVRGPLEHSRVITTKGYNLTYKYVFHGSCSKWGYGADQILEELISNTLEAANNKNVRSLAFPSIGTKGLSIPHKDLARIMMEAVLRFSQTHKETKLRNIYLVAHHRDNYTVTAFQQQINELAVVRKPEQSPAEAAFLTTRQLSLEPVESSAPSVPSGAKSFTTGAGITFSVIVGDIIEQKVDAIFNSTSVALDLSKGYVSAALLRAAGTQIQTEVYQEKPERFTHGDVVSTKGYDLGCKYVFHGACVRWDQVRSEQVLRSLITKSLSLASKLRLKSLAFPSLGTGPSLKTPHRELARIMVQEMETLRRCSLIDVFVVAHYKDKQTVQAFEEAIQRNQPSSGSAMRTTMMLTRQLSSVQASSVDESKQSFTGKMENVSICIKVGDLTTEKVDAIVNCTDDRLSGAGGLCKAILKAGGEEVSSAYKDIHFDKNVAITTGGKLPCKNVIHLDISGKTTISGLKGVIKTCLKTCEESGLANIAFPAIGTGSLKQSTEKMALELMESVLEFVKKSQPQTLKIINVVVGKHAFAQYKQAFNEVASAKPKGLIQKACSIVKHPMQNARSIMEDNLYSLKSFQVQEQPKQTYGRPKAAIRNSGSLPHKSYSRTLTMTLCATGEADIQRATAFINQKADAVNHDKVIDDEAISYLTTEHRSDIKKLEDPFNLDITVDSNKITLTGLESDIMDVSKKIRDMLEEAKENKKNKEKAIELEQTVKWMVEDDCYPVEINYIIEMAYDRGDSEVEFKLKGCEKRIRFKDMQVESPGITPLSVKRECKGAKAFPADWVKMDDKTPYILVPIADDSPSYRQVSKAMKGGAATPFTITKMEKVQIPTLYRKYVQHKEEMEGKSTGGTVESSNLWHGAQNDKLKGINTKGFDRFNLGQKRQDLGQGVYFYKSIQDAIAQQSGSGTPKYVYRCKVLTGSYTKGVANAREAPPIDPNKPTILYDSCVDNPTAPAVFVAFKDMQAYPEILVTFQ